MNKMIRIQWLVAALADPAYTFTEQPGLLRLTDAEGREATHREGGTCCTQTVFSKGFLSPPLYPLDRDAIVKAIGKMGPGDLRYFNRRWTASQALDATPLQLCEAYLQAFGLDLNPT